MPLASRPPGLYRYVSDRFILAGFHTIAHGSAARGHASRRPQMLADPHCSRPHHDPARAPLAVCGYCL